ncbi:hypothetical protein X798_06573 [Onchocerca flexuosa]|uniref:Uncharacterized protein n=1 Tax=Onchocerca flexuosa TaxID=387005 RepID=A0A238BM07_9BILA|nr:hypothetical protein X798_06573 [Onchocerca flexuosa]
MLNKNLQNTQYNKNTFKTKKELLSQKRIDKGIFFNEIAKIAGNKSLFFPQITKKRSETKFVSRKDMGAAVIIFLLILIGLGVAYHMGILEPYIKEAQARMKQGSSGGPSQ